MRHIWPWVFVGGLVLLLCPDYTLAGAVVMGWAGRRLYAEWGQG